MKIQNSTLQGAACAALTTTLALLGLIASVPSAQSATVLFSDDFNSYTTGAYTGTTLGDWTLSNAELTGHEIAVVQDTGDLFGDGTSNQYLRFYDGGDNAGLAMRAVDGLGAGSNVITMSFSLIMPSGSSYLSEYVGTGAAPGGATLANVATLGTSRSPNYTLPSTSTAYRFDIVFNNSASTLSGYNGSGIDLASQRFDIWLNGSTRVVAGQGQVGSLSAGTAIQTITFQTSTGTVYLQESYIDWVTVFQGAEVGAIPEPSTGAMVVVGLLALGFLVRMRRPTWRAKPSLKA